MTKNQKIAIGCGAVGCLGLIVLIVLGGVGYYFFWEQASNRNSNRGVFPNTNINSNSNSEEEPLEANINSSRETPQPDTSDEVSSSMSDDDKHKLFQAAATSGDQQLMRRVMKKIGLLDGSTPENEKFMKNHIVWVFNNGDFIKQIDTPEKARAYVEANLD
ncbi:MAG TPA: hypothetical protein VMM84_09185 [Pyrinomonadaceae bacterium]|nr:hypothetical protein [Pyrinomonadaceae bacterium]